MEIRTQYVTLKVSDETEMRGWTARPAAGRARPGLIVFQEAFGVNAHIRDVTERFAREGYVAIAPNPGNSGLLGRAAELRCPILLAWGGQDKHILPEHRRAVNDTLTAEKKNFVDVEISDGDHGFFCDARPSYNPTAAALAWSLTLEFLKTYAGGLNLVRR
jgi:dienelactone hydrolase